MSDRDARTDADMRSDSDEQGKSDAHGQAQTRGAELSIVVFAFDEEENIAAVLGELRTWLDAHEPGAELVFVDDGSRDRTRDEAARALAGTRAFVTFLPADGQIAPDAVRTLRDAQRAHDADVVLSIYDHRDDGLDRKLLSAGVRALITLVHGVRLHSDGPYLFRRSLFVPAQLPPDTFFLNFEFPIRVLAAGLRVATVTIECRPRRAGFSKSTGLRRVAGVARDLLALRVRRFREAARALR
jgi:dolichol-phosphate mannosyltransferase